MHGIQLTCTFFCVLQIGEEMSQNSFIKQYLAKQQELLRQRMEREAREAAEADGKTSKQMVKKILTAKPSRTDLFNIRK